MVADDLSSSVREVPRAVNRRSKVSTEGDMFAQSEAIQMLIELRLCSLIHSMNGMISGKVSKRRSAVQSP